MQIVTTWMEEGLQQGLQQGRQDGEATVLLRLLERHFGSAAAAETERIRSLPTELLELLADELLDFAAPEDLAKWLAAKGA